MMIQHIVLWSFKDGVDRDAAFERIQKGFDACMGKVPRMRSLTLYRGFQGFEACLITTHDDTESLSAYQELPEHLAVKEIIAEVRSARASCDFVL